MKQRQEKMEHVGNRAKQKRSAGGEGEGGVRAGVKTVGTKQKSSGEGRPPVEETSEHRVC